jgi:hypothetical protein
MEKKLTAGYVVQDSQKSSRFLSRSGRRFVRHSSNHNKLGIERAWVHSEDSLLKKEKGLIPKSALLYPARYSHDIRYTGVGGNSTTYEEFLEANLALHI